MEDYKETMKTLFRCYYSTSPEAGKEKHISTAEVLRMFRGIIPSEPITEHDAYDVLQELGYQKELKVFRQTVPVLDDEGEPTGETREQETGRYFLWKVYERH